METRGNGEAAPGQERGILFADVCDSSRLFRVLGDERARDVIVRALDVARAGVEAAGGTVVDSIGDELFCTSPDADRLVRAGVGLQEATLAARGAGRLPSDLRFRVGLHHGPVGIDGPRVFGCTVHVARRIASLAKPEQVLATGETLRRLRAPPQSRLVEYTHVKGRPEVVEVVEIVWSLGSTVDVAEVIACELVLEELVLALGGGSEVVVSMTNPSATLGRDATSDLCVDDVRISRLHARVELRHGTFYLVDVSRNGSTVTADGAAPREVLRAEVALGRCGSVRLGSDSDGPLVSYRRRLAR